MHGLSPLWKASAVRPPRGNAFLLRKRQAEGDYEYVDDNTRSTRSAPFVGIKVTGPRVLRDLIITVAHRHALSTAPRVLFLNEKEGRKPGIDTMDEPWRLPRESPAQPLDFVRSDKCDSNFQRIRSRPFAQRCLRVRTINKCAEEKKY